MVTLYDLDSGRESVLWRAPQEGSWNVRDLSFSQDGSRVVIYTASTGKVGEVWVVNVSSATVESRHSTHFSGTGHFGAARLSPDNRRLYLARSDQGNERYSIQCLDLATNQEIWQTETQRDAGVTALAISPDGKVLVSGSGFADPTIRVWDAATGRLLRQLDGHTAWVCKLVFSRDGRQLISAASRSNHPLLGYQHLDRNTACCAATATRCMPSRSHRPNNSWPASARTATSCCGKQTEGAQQMDTAVCRKT